ncbi:hypothetical protein NMY22_g16532 [Coprinellus aureogranulatus]|nr:hypothetical protein NMY22_g16532 [Coprinellus aureogranulatus]
MASSYFDVASLALLVVDYLATVDMEIEHIWPAPWSPAKVLYLFSRYLAFFDIPFAVYYHTVLGLKPRMCLDMFRVGTTSIVAGVVFAEAILFLRVYALSGRNRKLMYCLIFQFTATHLAWISMFGVFFSGIEFGPSPLPSVLGCVILPPKKKIYGTLLAGMFGFLMANEILVALITFIIGLLKYRHMRHSPLITIFYRDGLFYFVSLTAFSIANMIVDIIGPPEFRFLMVMQVPPDMPAVPSTHTINHLFQVSESPAESEPMGLSAGQPNHTVQTMRFALNARGHPKAGTEAVGERSAWESEALRTNTAIHTDDIELAFTGSRK